MKEVLLSLARVVRLKIFVGKGRRRRRIASIMAKAVNTYIFLRKERKECT